MEEGMENQIPTESAVEATEECKCVEGKDCTCEGECSCGAADEELKVLSETENMELFKEDGEFVLDLAARGITLNFDKEEIAELKKLLSVDL